MRSRTFNLAMRSGPRAPGRAAGPAFASWAPLRDCTRVQGIADALGTEEPGDDDPPTVLDALENLAAILAWAAPAGKAKAAARAIARRRAAEPTVELELIEEGERVGWFGERMPARVRRGSAEGLYLLEGGREVDPIELRFVPPYLGVRAPFDPIAGINGPLIIHAEATPIEEAAFYISTRPVSAADVEAFCRVTRRRRSDPPEGSDPDGPAVDISWETASAFCRFVHGRLPHVGERRAATRGGTGDARGHRRVDGRPRADRGEREGPRDRPQRRGTDSRPPGALEGPRLGDQARRLAARSLNWLCGSAYPTLLLHCSAPPFTWLLSLSPFFFASVSLR
jgi:hypothetical protein